MKQGNIGEIFLVLCYRSSRLRLTWTDQDVCLKLINRKLNPKLNLRGENYES